MKPPRFIVAPGPHAPQLAIQAHDLTQVEVRVVRNIVTNQWMPSEDYKLKQACGAYLQGCEDPYKGSDGWILVEFWSGDRDAAEAFTKHVNEEIAKAEE